MDEHEALWRDYEQTLASFRQLADIRFKLLALLPSISGLAIGVISLNLEAFKSAPLPRMLIGVLGFVVTLGVVFYDQRNSQLYYALMHRAQKLEQSLKTKVWGQFCNRPDPSLRFLRLFSIWHGRGLALIYGSVLGSWLFPVACGALWLARAAEWGWPPGAVPGLSAIIAAVVAAGVIVELQRLNREASGRGRSKASEPGGTDEQDHDVCTCGTVT